MQVRSPFLAAQYPSSVQALYESSPDECIQEFYTSSTIFASIHDSMESLAVPGWAADVPAFLALHRCVADCIDFDWRLLHQHLTNGVAGAPVL